MGLPGVLGPAGCGKTMLGWTGPGPGVGWALLTHLPPAPQEGILPHSCCYLWGLNPGHQEAVLGLGAWEGGPRLPPLQPPVLAPSRWMMYLSGEGFCSPLGVPSTPCLVALGGRGVSCKPPSGRLELWGAAPRDSGCEVGAGSLLRAQREPGRPTGHWCSLGGTRG